MAIYLHIRRATQRCFARFLRLCPRQSRLLQFYDLSRPNALLVIAASLKPRRIFMRGATGTIGRATVRVGDVTSPASLARDGFKGEHCDAVVSCMA